MEKEVRDFFSSNGSRVLSVRHGIDPTLVHIYSKIKMALNVHDANLAMDLEQTCRCNKHERILEYIKLGFVRVFGMSGLFVRSQHSADKMIRITSDLKSYEVAAVFKDGYGGKLISYDELTTGCVVRINGTFYPIRVIYTADKVLEAIDEFNKIDSIKEAYYGK